MTKIENQKTCMFRNYLVNRLYLQKINLKKPLSRGSQFKLHFLPGVTGKSRTASKFPCHLFSKGHRLIIPNYKTFQ